MGLKQEIAKKKNLTIPQQNLACLTCAQSKAQQKKKGAYLMIFDDNQVIILLISS